METKEKNEIIANFMGLERINCDIILYAIEGVAYPINNLKYHNSWDWLMPVVHRISEYRIAYPDQANKVCNARIVVGIKYLHTRVVEFIQWYNQQPR